VVTITVTCYSWAPSCGDHLFSCDAISRPPLAFDIAGQLLFPKSRRHGFHHMPKHSNGTSDKITWWVDLRFALYHRIEMLNNTLMLIFVSKWFWSDQSRRHVGAFWELSPQTKLQAPPNWKMKHYRSVEFLFYQTFRLSSQPAQT